MYKLTVQTLESMKNDDFESFWDTTMKNSGLNKVKVPEMKRKTKLPARFIDSSDSEEEEFPENIKEHYKKIYIQAYDLIIKCLKNRFEQENLKHYENLQELLMLAANHEDYTERLNLVIEHYKDDFDVPSLRAQIKIFSRMFPDNEKTTYGNLIAHFKQLGSKKNLISEVCKIMELILVLPASNAGVERSFSKMKTIKTRLRSTMKEGRLNHLMIMGIYKDKVDKLNLEKIANEFIKRKEIREKVFGKAQN